MAKTSAERQKAYRERKKQTDPDYMRNEVLRVQKHQTPRHLLSSKEKSILRRRAREGMQALRKKIKQGVSAESGTALDIPDGARRSQRFQSGTDQILAEASSSSGNNIENRDGIQHKQPNHLIVRLPALTMRERSKKQSSAAISNLKRKLSKVTDANVELQRRLWRTEKRLRRQSSAAVTRSHQDAEQLSPTPLKMACHLLRADGISPRKAPGVKRALVLHNSIMAEATCLPRKMRIQLMGKHIQRTRCARELSKRLKIDCRTVRAQIRRKSKTTARAIKSNLIRHDIQKFLVREDNAVCLPGKRDCVKVGKQTKQKYILSDYMMNLYQKYLSEHQSIKVSASVFYDSRPKNVLPVRYAKRAVCLCQRHQNFALKLDAVKSVGFVTSPDKFIQTIDVEGASTRLQELLDKDLVQFMVWKKVDVQYDGKTVKRVKLVHETLSKCEFIVEFNKEHGEFRKHSQRVTAQYKGVHKLKATLPQNHATAQMDFAENYTASHMAEIQSAYFCKAQITVHPVVVHYRDQDTLKHKSYVMITDDRNHIAAAVYCFIKKLIPQVKLEIPNLECIHYLSDSPTSQYRNKHIFYIIAHHQNLLGVKASWQYFESGHGKGPCDGVGGSCKRMADLAVKRGFNIQNAVDFCEWGNGRENVTKVEYILVTTDEIVLAQEELTAVNPHVVKGTLGVHSVFPVADQPGTIATRETSCFNDCCFLNGCFPASCEGWVVHDLTHNQQNQLNFEVENPSTNSFPLQLVTNIPIIENITKDQYVAALYDGDWFVAHVLEVDEDDDELHLSFMVPTNTKIRGWKWSTSDKLWVKAQDVICVISDPLPSGKSHRIFNVVASDLEFIQNYMLAQSKAN